jgi:hypothetical protein
MSENTLSAPDLWALAVDKVKDRINSRSLWEALERSVALTIEQDTLIIGLNSRFFNLSSHMTGSESRNTIDQIVQQLSGRPLRVRVIDGDSLSDWAAVQRAEERVALMRQQDEAKKTVKQAASSSWDEIYDQAAKAYSGLAVRQLPQSKAKYLKEMIGVLAEAVTRLYPEVPDEHNQRMYARVIDRVAHNAEVPAAWVALEVDRFLGR